MTKSAPHTADVTYRTNSTFSRDLILGLASAAPSGFFLGSAVVKEAPGIGALILLIALVTGLIVWYLRKRARRGQEEPLLTETEIERDLDGAPTPSTSL